MRWPASPQTRFLLRAASAFIALLAVWWFLLLPPLLGWARVSTDILLNLFPGAPLKTGIVVMPGGVWVLQAPVSVGGAVRNVTVESIERLPTQLTLAFPFFWAIVLAAPWTRRSWRVLASGTAVLLLLPPLGLLSYAAHVVQLYVFPHAPAIVARALAALDYVATTVLPYIGPVLLALALDPELRASVLAGDTAPIRDLTSNS
jgi:hypothetical protein